MEKINNIINFYLMANKLKEKIRTGWIETSIEKERLESVAEHIYGCLILAIGINSEYKLKLNMQKVLKMLALHELEEILMGDLTLRNGISPEEKKELGKKCVHEVVKDLYEANEIELLLEEFNQKKTEEAKFCYMIDKLECDFQAKIYDLQGAFRMEKAKEDLAFYGDKATEIEAKAKTASDIWLEYDKTRFVGNKIHNELINELQRREEL